MGIISEDEEGRVPTRSELIHLLNIWLDLAITIRKEVGDNPEDMRGISNYGRSIGLDIAAQDLLELLGLYSDENPDDYPYGVE